jgi:hypothetical protein
MVYENKIFQRLFLLIFFFLFKVLQGDAQVKITGKVLSSDSLPLNRATIKVLNLSPEKEMKALTTDSSGMFQIEKLSVGKYYLKISFIGYKPLYSGVFEVIGSEFQLNIGDFILFAVDKDLKTIIVKANQKTIEQSEGKIVMNLRNSATAAGASALEVLERLPNVTINRQNSTICLKGKEGSVVMINGKRTYLPNEALLQLLSGINASKIDKIELITNPSAAMDAEGNAGIINIITAKSNLTGLNGSVESQIGYGNGSVYGFNGNVNYKINKLGMYLSYSISRINQNQLSFNSRRNSFDGNDFLISTNSERDPIQRNHNLRIEMDYQINDTTSMGGSISTFDNKWSMSALNKTKISIGINDTNLIIINSEINHWKHIGGNIYFQTKLKNNKAFSLSLNYLSYYDNNPSFYNISYLDHQNSYLFNRINKSGKTTPIDIVVPQLNYTLFSGNCLKIKVGSKCSFSNFNDNVVVSSLVDGNWSNNQALTGKSEFKESIIAGFVEANYKIKEKIKINAGIRYEWTDFYLTMNEAFQNIYRKYGNLFPTFSLSYRANSVNSMSVFYSKRINRPTFNDIAPFILFIDPYTFFSGNSAIQPSYTNTIGTDFNFHNFLFSLSYSYEANSLAKFQISVDPTTNLETVKPVNLYYTKSFSTGLIMPISITSWWDFQSSINGIWQEIKTGSFQSNRTLNLLGFQMTGSQSFKLLKDYLVEVSGFYNTKMFAGTSLIQPYGGLNIGIQKKWNHGSALRLNLNDVFNSIKSTALIQMLGYDIKNGYDFSQRTLKISYTYTFGVKVASHGNKAGLNAEEDRKRVE